MSASQLSLTQVPTADLAVGDRVSVGFAPYGEVPCPIIAPPSERIMNNGRKTYDVTVRIGDSGPAYTTPIPPSAIHWVIR